MMNTVDGAATGGLEGRRVFIAEDESLVAMLLEDTLEDIGCEIAGMASRYAEASAQAERLDFDVAILDVNLNGEQSYPIAQALLQRGLPFIFSTGYGSANIPGELRRAPVVRKPFQQADLERALRVALGLSP